MKKYFIIGLLAIILVLPAGVKAQTTSTATAVNTDDVMAALRQQMSNLLQQIDKMQEELSRLRGEVVKVEEQIEKLTKRLQIGSTDKEVKTLQEFLKRDPEVYPEGLVTGYYGALTEKAVKKFQEKNGIEAIGVVGPKTLEKINKVIEEKKITICHIPSENPEKKQTITISKSALEAHMAHGDKMGACEGETIPTPTPTPIQKPIPTTPVCIQVITPAKDPTTGNCKIFPTPCDVPNNWINVDNCPISGNQPPIISGVGGPTALKIGEIGTWTVKASDPEQGALNYSVIWGDEAYGISASQAAQSTSYIQATTFTHSYSNAGIYNPVFIVVDNNGLSAKTSISVNVGEATPAVIYEQVKCVFKGSTGFQKCNAYTDNSSSVYYGKGCGGTETCVVDLKGYKGDKITWKSSCGGYAYTVMDGNNEYAEFVCPSTSSFINVLSPNGGEVWAKGSTQILQWQSSVDISTVYIKLRKGSDTYPGSEGMINGMISNAGTNPGSHQWTIPTTLPDGNDYAIRVIDKTGAVLDDSDAPFSIVTMVSQNQAPKITGGSVPPSLIQIGQTVNFSWNAEDSNKDNLVWSVNWGDGESMLGACPSSNPSNGQGWTLNTFHKWQQAGTYTVKTAVSDCKGGIYSQNLTVNVDTTVAPYITVISPNGGETWYMGKTYDILWKSSGVEKVYIAAKVFKDGVSVGALGIASSAENVWGSLGKYSWTPNSNHLREGNQIKIEISNTETPASGISTPETLPSDESDNYFKIIDQVSSQDSLSQMANSLNSIKSILEKMINDLR